MSDEQQPRAEWIFPEQPKKRAGRVWLIIGIVVAALIVIGTVVFFVIPRDATPGPRTSPTPSASPTRSASPTPTTSPTATASATPSAAPVPSDAPSEPITTPPPVQDPDMGAFTSQVQPWLDDATTGLGMVANMSGQEAVQVVDSLQGDADRLSNVVAPSSISLAWYDGVSQYSARLADLRRALDGDGDPQSTRDAASTALQELRALVGL
jgi:cytoskeletal protein RodZ